MRRKRELTAVGTGRAIRQARKACGLTQDQLGVRLKLKGGPQAVYRWERGSSAPTARSAGELVRVLTEINKKVAEELGVTLALARGEPPALAPSETPNPNPGASAVPGAIGANGATTRATDAATSREQPAETPFARPPVPEPRPMSSDRFTVEYLVLRMADELEVPARRVRMPLLQLLRALQESSLPLGVVMQELARWIEVANARAVSSRERVQ